MIQSMYRRTYRVLLFPFLLLILFLQIGSTISVGAESTNTTLHADSINQDIVLDPWGNLFYYFTYDLSNFEESIIYEFDLQLPKEAEDVTVYDEMGILFYDLTEGENGINATILLRYPLRGVINEIVFNDSCSFTVKYRGNVQNIVTDLDSWDQFRLQTTVSANLNWTIEDYVVTITLPEGAKSLQTTPPNVDIVHNIFTQSLSFTFQNVTSLTAHALSVDYDYLFLWSVFRPGLWIGILVLIIGGFTVIRRRRRSVSSVVIRKNVALLQSFVETCDRRLMVRSELNSLEELLDEKRIGKKDYNRRKRILAQRVQVLNKALIKLATGVKQEDPKYRTFIERIERSEQEITSVTREITHLQNQFRSRKISKKNYRTTKRKYHQRLDRATAELEGILFELKAEAR
jgi:uncharacterized protein (UPF0335 family)